MFPTYDVGDRFIAEKLTFRERGPRAGDVIIFKPPPIEGYTQRSWFLSEDIFIKRVVGVAGDTLEVRLAHYAAAMWWHVGSSGVGRGRRCELRGSLS